MASPPHRLVASASTASPHPPRPPVRTPMATTVATSPFPFQCRNLILSCSKSSSPRSAFLPPRVAPIAVRSSRLLATPARRRTGLLRRHRLQGARSSALRKMRMHEILGVSPLDGFDQVKMAYKKRRKEAVDGHNAEYLTKLKGAYDTVMLEQLQNWKKGVTYGSIQVSRDIKYADNLPIVSWGPRYSGSTIKDLRINTAISAAFIIFISTLGHADWKPLQFMCFAYFYRILEKLKATEPAITHIYNEYGGVEGWGIHMAKQVLRSFGLVLGSILAASLGYTELANLSQFLGHYIPFVVYNFQELIVTTASSALLCILASYYR